jgi:Xaa-Pro dipeptidase
VKTRLEKLQRLLTQCHHQALAINAGSSLTYLTGLHFHLMERPVLLLIAPEGTPALVLPELELQKLDSHALMAFPYGENPSGWATVCSQAITSLGIAPTSLGIEPHCFRYLEGNLLREALPGLGFEDGTATLAKLRSVKEETELTLLREAVSIAERALATTLKMVRIGVTEREIAAERCG